MNICVYCSSSNHIDSVYPDAARTLGRLLAEREHALVYGGGNVGLMGILARTLHEEGGHVIGVIPEKLKAKEGIAYGVADELVVTETMRERKKVMYTRGEGFAVLPGGFGTLEEFMEVLTLKQLDYHERPIALINTNGFFDPLLGFFDQLYEKQFTRAPADTLIHVTPDPAEALDFIEEHATASPASEAF
jgi:uncharacterized protein (TIGR00730 family)